MSISGTGPYNRLLVYASESGGGTLDLDEQGGNPFATALIQAAADADLPLVTLHIDFAD